MHAASPAPLHGLDHSMIQQDARADGGVSLRASARARPPQPSLCRLAPAQPGLPLTTSRGRARARLRVIVCAQKSRNLEPGGGMAGPRGDKQ